MASPTSLRLGTRGSPLALWQANAVARALVAAHGSDAAPEIVPIKTSGDKVSDRPLREVGGKGLFTKELEEALRARTIDLAVHSVKDMPSQSAPGLRLAACLPRASACDVLLTRDGRPLDALATGAVVGTTSLRRQAQLLRKRPDLVITPLRGNVGSRLSKLEAGAFDAIVLARAGLDRLALSPAGTVDLAFDDMLPAVGQGAVGIEIRAEDETLAALLAAIDDAPTSTAVRAERAYLSALNGSCTSPIAGNATLAGTMLTLRGRVLSPDGREDFAAHLSRPAEDAHELGAVVAEEILARAPVAFVAAYLRDT